MRALISGPTNSTQVEFNRLCQLGGGARGGPAREDQPLRQDTVAIFDDGIGISGIRYAVDGAI